MVHKRDAFVLVIMAFGFGVLAAWGLFYEWGSAPQTKPVDLPAWIQAVGSVLAICVAAFIPIMLWQREEEYRVLQRRLKAKALAFKLGPLIDNLGYATKRASYRLNGSNSYLNLQDIIDGLKPERAWQDHYQDLEHLGHVGEMIQSTILANERLSSLLDDWETFYRSGGIHHDPETDEVHEIPEPEPWDTYVARSLWFLRETEIAIDRLLEHHAASAKS